MVRPTPAPHPPGPAVTASATRSSRAVFILGRLWEQWGPLLSGGLIAGAGAGGRGEGGQQARHRHSTCPTLAGPHPPVRCTAAPAPWRDLRPWRPTPQGRGLPSPVSGLWTEASAGSAAHCLVFLSLAPALAPDVLEEKQPSSCFGTRPLHLLLWSLRAVSSSRPGAVGAG